MSWKEIGTILFLFFIGVALADTNQELKAISYLESSSGKNLNHPVIGRGMHKGHQAGGRYGLMPLTVVEIVSKSELKDRYPYLLNLSHQEITAELNRDPVMDKEIAKFLWNKLRKTRCPLTAAHAWYHGPHASKDRFNISPYVIKFKMEMEKNEAKIKRTGPVGISATR